MGEGGFIVLAATLSAVGHVPVAGPALILGIDRFMSEARALTNIIGNGVAKVVVGKWCKELDERQMHRHLNQETELEANEPEAVLGQKDEHMPVSKTSIPECNGELDPTRAVVAR